MPKWIMSLIWSIIWASLTTWFLLWLNTKLEFTGWIFIPSVIEFIHSCGFMAWKVLFAILVVFYYLTKLYEFPNVVLFAVIGTVTWVAIVCVVLVLALGFGTLIINALCN